MRKYQLKYLPKKQQGVALISVLLIIALASILTTKMNGRLLMQLQRTSNIESNQQAYWYALGAESFAKGALLEAVKQQPDVTDLEQFWAQDETTYPVDNGEIVGKIIDLQSCFNLNALRNKKTANNQNTGNGTTNNKPVAVTALENLLELFDGVDTFQAETMADALVDWLDKDDLIGNVGGAEDSDYLSKVFPYLAANNFIATVNELRTIEHFTPEVITELKKYACVIPNNGLHKINVNTIDAENPELLQALLGVSKSEAESILSGRQQPFKKIEDFLDLPSVKSQSLTDDQKAQFTVDSDFFLLTATASFNNSYVSLRSIMQVENNQRINVITRSIGRE